MKIAVIRIAEEGVDVDVASTGPTVSNITIIYFR
jgi:hypothetical protein